MDPKDPPGQGKTSIYFDKNGNVTLKKPEATSGGAMDQEQSNLGGSNTGKRSAEDRRQEGKTDNPGPSVNTQLDGEQGAGMESSGKEDQPATVEEQKADSTNKSGEEGMQPNHEGLQTAEEQVSPSGSTGNLQMSRGVGAGLEPSALGDQPEAITAPERAQAGDSQGAYSSPSSMQPSKVARTDPIPQSLAGSFPQVAQVSASNEVNFGITMDFASPTQVPSSRSLLSHLPEDSAISPQAPDSGHPNPNESSSKNKSKKKGKNLTPALAGSSRHTRSGQHIVPAGLDHNGNGKA